MPLGGAQQYLASYAGYVLPGYVQQESFDSAMNIAEHYGTYADGSNSEHIGLQNKAISIRLKVWEQDYASCKDQVRDAATILRSKKGFHPIYIQNSDKYYEVLVRNVRMEKTVGESVRTLDYEVQLEAKPWYYSVSGYTLTGTGTISTDQVGRTIFDGGWTPTRITLSGTNVTVSGYTETGDFTGFISVSGTVSNMIIDSNTMEATLGGENANHYMRWVDYRMEVGPGKTYFTSTGASSMTITYHNRWYL